MISVALVRNYFIYFCQYNIMNGFLSLIVFFSILSSEINLLPIEKIMIINKFITKLPKIGNKLHETEIQKTTQSKTGKDKQNKNKANSKLNSIN